ncbi:MAG: hypothetical protein ABI554_07520 [Flavobacterium sp.]
MKKIIIASFLVLGLVKMNAQTATDNVTLNVKLHPIQTLVVNPAQKTVNLDYNTVGDYKDGVTSTQADHLTIYSTGGFQVKVKSAGDLAETSAGTEKIATNSIQITAKAGTNGLTAATYSSTSLESTEKSLITSTTGGVDKKINIEYKGAGADAYVNKYIAGQNPTIYTTTVTYTIVSQ